MCTCEGVRSNIRAITQTTAPSIESGAHPLHRISPMCRAAVLAVALAAAAQLYEADGKSLIRREAGQPAGALVEHATHTWEEFARILVSMKYADCLRTCEEVNHKQRSGCQELCKGHRATRCIEGVLAKSSKARGSKTACAKACLRACSPRKAKAKDCDSLCGMVLPMYTEAFLCAAQSVMSFSKAPGSINCEMRCKSECSEYHHGFCGHHCDYLLNHAAAALPELPRPQKSTEEA